MRNLLIAACAVPLGPDIVELTQGGVDHASLFGSWFGVLDDLCLGSVCC
jgi:hypothetical protein